MARSAYDYLREEEERRRRSGFLPHNNRPSREISSLADAIAANSDLNRSLGGPMYAGAQDAQTPDVSTMTRPRRMQEPPVPGSRWQENLEQTPLPDWQEKLEQFPARSPVTGSIPLEERTTRPRRVFEQPPGSSTLGRPRYTNPISYDTSGMPERRAHNYGAEPLDTSLQYRNALENWRPSGGDRSLRNVGAGAGYGALLAGQGAPNDESAALRMAGGGLAGLISSLVKPSSKNWMRRGIAIGEADAEVARQLKLASEQAKLRQMEVNPYLREIGLNQGQQRIDQNRDRIAQQANLAHKRALASIYNGAPEFDPDDPKNAAVVAAMEAVFGFRPPKKTRGSMFQMVQGTDENGNATFSMVHKPTASATQVTGTGLPAQTEPQLNRDARQDLEEYRQGQINEREERANRGEARGLTPGQIQTRRDRAGALIAEIESARAEAEKFQGEANKAAADPATKRYQRSHELDRDAALERGNKAARELNTVFGDWYEAGSGEGGWTYWKEKARTQRQEDPKIRQYADQFFNSDYGAAEEAIRQQRGGPQSQPSGRSIEGAIKAFRKKVGRDPTAAEITSMKAALGQRGGQQRGGKYAGQRMSASKLPEAARRLGMTVEQARQYLSDEGMTIY